MNLTFARNAINVAKEVGFTRVQFTGGEPLLHPEITAFVKMAASIVSDVGITTNGTYLKAHISNLLAAGLSRLHISLQTESLIEAGAGHGWGVPEWLEPALKLAAGGSLALQLNMPVPVNMFAETAEFLKAIAPSGCDLKLFSILPEGGAKSGAYPLIELQQMVSEENNRRTICGQNGKILLRDYRPPAGMRCGACVDRERCKEQSHSLRLGADRVLRPCLATRAWDSEVSEANLRLALEDATLLAADY